MGPTGVGINSFTTSMVSYFTLLASLGINIYGSRTIAFVRDDAEKTNSVFWSLVFLRIILSLGVFLLYLMFSFSQKKYVIIYLVQGINIAAGVFDISWFFQGIENFKTIVMKNIWVKLFSITFIFIFVKNQRDLLLYIAVVAISQLFGNITLWPNVLRTNKISTPKHVDVLTHLKPASMMFLPQIATTVYLQLNKSMLGSIAGVVSAGYFDNSDKIIKMILALVTALSTVMLPHVTNAFAQGKMKAVQKALSVSMHFTLMIAFPLTFGLMAVSKPFSELFFGSQFKGINVLMFTESVVIVIISISSVIGNQYLLPTNQVKHYTNSVILGALMNVILNIPMIVLWGAEGAVWATILSEISVSLYQLVMIKGQLNLFELFKESEKYLIASTIMYICLINLNKVIRSDFRTVAIDILVGAVVFVICLWVLKPKYIIDVIKGKEKI